MIEFKDGTCSPIMEKAELLATLAKIDFATVEAVYLGRTAAQVQEKRTTGARLTELEKRVEELISEAQHERATVRKRLMAAGFYLPGNHSDNATERIAREILQRR